MPPTSPLTPKYAVFRVFQQLVEARRNGVLIERHSRRDKEFHFQDWVEARIQEAGYQCDTLGRNKYPDFVLPNFAEGYEVKGLEWPGRVENFDANSQIPKGFFKGRQIFYVFGRYPSSKEQLENPNQYPVIDLVVCHGSFLNADSSYKHENKHVDGFGSYGDIMIRDRKMYVVPTPFALTEPTTTGLATLILPKEMRVEAIDPYIAPKLQLVGNLIREEAAKILVAYSFDLRSNQICERFVENPHAGRKHEFLVYRMKGDSQKEVRIAPSQKIPAWANKEDINEHCH